MLSDLPLPRAISAKMDYLNMRQQIIAQNIANADTPDYQSKDLTKVDFGAVLKGMGGQNAIVVEKTNDKHFGGMGEKGRAKDKNDRITYEVAPDKNGVIIEEQMVKASEIQMDYNLLANLSSKNSMMYKIAIGSQG